MPLLKCPCGTEKLVSDYAITRGRKYCSDICARKYRVYEKSAATKSAVVCIPMTEGQRKTLEAQAALNEVSLTEMARRFIIAGLEGAA